MKTANAAKNVGRQPESASEVALRELEAIAAEWVARQRERINGAG